MSYKMERYHTSRFYVGLVEASEHHNYPPLWTLVGGGLKKFEESPDKMVHIHSADVQVHQNIVTEFQPEENKVKLLCGRELEYKQLIVALGLTELVKNFRSKRSHRFPRPRRLLQLLC